MTFSLAYLPAAERLTIVVMKARNIRSVGKKTAPDSYVKVSILNKDGRKIKKKKTSTQKSTMNPTYNEEIVFTHLKKELLNEIVIKLTIFHDSITNREALGTLLISSESQGNKYIQWKEMIDGKKSIAWCHSLLPISSNEDSDGNNNSYQSSSVSKISTRISSSFKSDSLKSN